MVKQSDQITGLTDNKELFRVASIVPAEKLGTVLMVDMGPLYGLPRSGLGTTTILEDGVLLVRTQEKPDGALYRQAWHLIVRPLIEPATPGVPIDAYAVSESDLAQIRGKDLTDNLLNYLVDRDPAAYKRIRPLLDDLRSAELPYQAFWSRSERRQVILVTTQLLMNPHLIELGLSNGTLLRVHNEWNEDCLATAGDAVVVTDAEAGSGYRVEAQAFESSYSLV